MGKFDGILLCTDLDDTMLTSDKKVSGENSRAIEYFKSEGGLFTFATGRVPAGAKLLLEYIHPNAPMICFNGAAIYDFKENKILWARELDDDAVNVARFIDASLPHVGIEVCTANKIYFSKSNRIIEEHKILEKFPDNYVDYEQVTEKWVKVIFMAETDEMRQLRDTISSSPFAGKYEFMQSSPRYYELLPKGASKGEGLLHLAELLGIKHSNTIAVGDNENDIMMIKLAGTSVAVANAIDEIKENADYITVDNNSGAIAAVIYGIESGKIKMRGC